MAGKKEKSGGDGTNFKIGNHLGIAAALFLSLIRRMQSVIPTAVGICLHAAPLIILPANPVIPAKAGISLQFALILQAVEISKGRHPIFCNFAP